MIKYIFSDLDGTLLYHTLPSGDHNRDFLSSNSIAPENIEEIQQLKLSPITFSIATGRADGDIHKIEEMLLIKGYRISQNGAFVFNKKNELIVNNSFSKVQALEVIEKLESNGLFFFYICPNRIFFSTNYPQKIKDAIMRNSSFLIKIDLECDARNAVEKEFLAGHVSVHISQGENQYEKESRIKEIFGDEYNVFISSPRSIDITRKGSTKGEAIKKIMKIENLKSNEIAVIGDSWNDASMFEVTPNSFVMSHSDPKIKARARFEIPSVGAAIRTINRINRSKNNE
jgi:Cof subfamily protein (haloacid dehalogenase superfamily)